MADGLQRWLHQWWKVKQARDPQVSELLLVLHFAGRKCTHYWGFLLFCPLHGYFLFCLSLVFFWFLFSFNSVFDSYLTFLQTLFFFTQSESHRKAWTGLVLIRDGPFLQPLAFLKHSVTRLLLISTVHRIHKSPIPFTPSSFSLPPFYPMTWQTQWDMSVGFSSVQHLGWERMS